MRLSVSFQTLQSCSNQIQILEGKKKVRKRLPQKKRNKTCFLSNRSQSQGLAFLCCPATFTSYLERSDCLYLTRRSISPGLSLPFAVCFFVRSVCPLLFSPLLLCPVLDLFFLTYNSLSSPHFTFFTRPVLCQQFPACAPWTPGGPRDPSGGSVS